MQPHSRLGVYELVDELGAGGMGVVWRAHDERLGRDVALKILPPHLAEREDAAIRFEREARGLAALSHPNIISIFDLGEQDGVRYLVTELLSGETLRDALRNGPLPWRRAIAICATIADGLAAAHAKGILHRDLKPENIFITTDDRVKILDFGLAKEVSLPDANATTVAHQTEPGRVLGTLGYTSPEQLRSEEIDFASDIFAVGCILYELISGRPAFLRNSAADTIAAILTVEPPLLTDVPVEVALIAKRCMEKKRAARFQSASDLAFALRHLSTTSDRITIPSPAPSRRKLWIVGAAVVVLAATVGLFVLDRPAAKTQQVAQPSAIAPMALAVIPFTADADSAYAGEGIAETLFRRLAPLRSVRVVARKSAGTEKTVLRGSIHQEGPALRVEAEIVEQSGRVLWKQTYRGAPADLLTLHTRVGNDVAEYLRAHTRGDEGSVAAPAMTVDAEAYREYLKGRHHWNKFTVPAFKQAIEHFQRSIDRDPTYALAYAGLADAYTMLAFHGNTPAEWIPKGRAAAMRATELDPQLGEGHTSLGTVLALFDWDWAGAERSLRRGVELNPGYATAHHAYGVLLGVLGRRDEARRELRIASELDPLSLVIAIDVAWAEFLHGDLDAAIAGLEAAARHDPKSPLARHELAWYLDHAGRHADAIEATATGLSLEGYDPAIVDQLRVALRTGGTQAYFRKKLELYEAAGYPQATRAALLIKLGEYDRAIETLEASVRSRERDVIYLKASPTYEPLRGNPRFDRLVATVF
jgi:tetratricopeptide (TPR) repeat protein/TolB-like protein